MEDALSRLEMEYELQDKITAAYQKLTSDTSVSKSVRRSRDECYRKAYHKVSSYLNVSKKQETQLPPTDCTTAAIMQVYNCCRGHWFWQQTPISMKDGLLLSGAYCYWVRHVCLSVCGSVCPSVRLSQWFDLLQAKTKMFYSSPSVVTKVKVSDAKIVSMSWKYVCDNICLSVYREICEFIC